MANQKVPQPLGAKPGFFYGYIIAVAASFIMFISQGIYTAFGVFFNPVLTEFGWTRAMTSGAYSLSLIVMGMLSIAAGALNDRLGPRIVLTACGLLTGLGYLLMSQISALWQLYLFYGIIIGIGMSGFWVPLVSTMARWFVKRRSAMTGFVIAGIGVGGLIASPLANHLISTYDWRMSYVILGIVVLVTILSAAQLLRRDPTQKGLVSYDQNETQGHELMSGAKSLSFKEAVYARQFWLFVAMLFCLGFSLFAILVHIAPHAIELGISAASAAYILATFCGVSTLGNVVLGSAGDRIGNRQVFIISFVLQAAALSWLMPAAEVWKLYLSASIFGFAIGGASAVESPLAAEIFGLKSHGLIYGVATCLGVTFGGAIGLLLTGFIFDITGSYQVAFLICAIVSLVGLISAAVLRPIRQTQVKT